jgi:hypothetical protein
VSSDIKVQTVCMRTDKIQREPHAAWLFHWEWDLRRHSRCHLLLTLCTKNKFNCPFGKMFISLFDGCVGDDRPLEERLRMRQVRLGPHLDIKKTLAYSETELCITFSNPDNGASQPKKSAGFLWNSWRLAGQKNFAEFKEPCPECCFYLASTVTTDPVRPFFCLTLVHKYGNSSAKSSFQFVRFGAVIKIRHESNSISGKQRWRSTATNTCELSCHVPLSRTTANNFLSCTGIHPETN